MMQISLTCLVIPLLCFVQLTSQTNKTKTEFGSRRSRLFFNLFSPITQPNTQQNDAVADLKAAQFLLQSIEKSSLTRKEFWQIKEKLSGGLKVCPLNRGAVRIGDSCHEFFIGKENFPTARQVCRSFSGDLSSIDLQGNFLNDIRRFYPTLSIDGTHHETWLGATRIRGSNNFQFFDGRIVHSSNARWNSGPRVHNCLIMDDVDLFQDMIIDDCDCFNKRSFLCQYRLIKLF